MSPKPRKAIRARAASPSLVAEAMLQRIKQRAAVSGTLKIPAVPALADEYVAMCSTIFGTLGRGFTGEEIADASALVSARLDEAYRGSQRSKITVNFHAEAGSPLGYEIVTDINAIADAYEKWIGPGEEPLFGAHADARILSLAAEAGEAASSPALDLGAGTGRNAFALARRGHPVDAVEITPKFAEMLATEAAKQCLPVRVIAHDVFASHADLRRDYRLFFASEVVPDFRGTAELRALFELAAEVLVEGGVLVFNVHLVDQGYTPEKAARQFSQQCYSALFTPGEVVAARAGLPLELLANDAVHDYEESHLPKDAWPPTRWYVNWISGLDVYDIARDECPVTLRWLAYRKKGSAALANAGATATSGGRTPDATVTEVDREMAPRGRSRRIDPNVLRQGVLRRLKRRAIASGILTLPAVPAMLEVYLDMWFAAFRALGRSMSDEELAEGRRVLDRVLGQAFATSQRSNIVLTYEAPAGSELRYSATADPVPLTTAYEDWLAALPEPLFGSHPDARLLALLAEMGDPSSIRVLDVGAGLGRNALPLARRGHSVDAVEITPKFAEHLSAEAARETLGRRAAGGGRAGAAVAADGGQGAGRGGLAIRVIAGDLFEGTADLARDYRLMLLSGVVGDFRDQSQLRRLFELATEVLAVDGRLLLSMHVAAEGYTPDRAAREWGQQCCAMFFTRDELASATAGLPLELLSDDSAHDYEQEHLPEEAWPPTAIYAEWALGQHMYALDRERCPIELRWLVFRRIDTQRGLP